MAGVPKRSTFMTRFGSRLVLLLIVFATIGCDRVTKHVASATIAGEPGQSFFADTVRLEYVENRGAFLSLGADWPSPVRAGVFIVGNAIALVALTVMAWRLRWSGTLLLGAALFVAGGVSNLLDRVVYGAVVDFLNVGVGPMRTGIFNVADIALLVGAVIVAVAGAPGAPVARTAPVAPVAPVEPVAPECERRERDTLTSA